MRKLSAFHSLFNSSAPSSSASAVPHTSKAYRGSDNIWLVRCPVDLAPSGQRSVSVEAHKFE